MSQIDDSNSNKAHAIEAKTGCIPMGIIHQKLYQKRTTLLP